jgi:hypothetical protein
VYVAGLTASPDFPTAAPSPAALAGGTDAFVTKLSPGGGEMLYSTFLGGADRDAATGITVDAAGNAYVVGTTSSLNFPVVSPIQAGPALGDPYEDVFVARLDATGHTTFATYLGGTGVDISSGVVVDGQGELYLTGGTSSTDFPITTGLAGTSPDRGNSFIVKLQMGGGSGDDRVAVDQLALFRQGKHGGAVPTGTVHPGHKVLFVGLYHTIGVTAAEVHATIWFTMAGRTILTRAMQRAASSDRRPMFLLVWQPPQNIEGALVAHIKLSVGTASATRTLRFKVAAPPS